MVNGGLKYFGVLLILCVSLFVNVYAFSGAGAGTSGDPFQITNWTTLNEIRDNLVAYYTLMNNLNSSTADYAGIGNSWTSINGFRGILDGNEKTISNINAPLFLEIINANISNLGITDINITGTERMGALVGTQLGGTIENCYSTGNIFSGSESGGLIGYNSDSPENDLAYVINSYSEVNMYSSGGNSIGGLIGETQSMGYVKNSYAVGSVIGNLGVGGLIGWAGYGEIINSYSACPITAVGSDGGLIGSNMFASAINSYWDMNISGQSTSQGGTGKTTIQMKNISTFSAWNISLTSDDLNNGYSFLAWQANNASYTWLMYDDIFAPVLSFVSPSETSGSSISRNSLTVNISVADSNFANLTVNLYNSDRSLNQSNFSTSNPYFINYTGLSDAIYYFNVSSYDLLGNSNSSETRNVTLDTINPAIYFYNNTNNGSLYQNWVFANISVADSNLDSVTIYLYNSTSLVNSSTSSSGFSINFTNLAYGNYFLNASANDSSSNINKTDTYNLALLEEVVLSATDGSTGGGYRLVQYNLTDAQLSGGISKYLRMREKILFEISNQTHTLTLNYFNRGIANVTIASTPKNYTLQLGQIVSIDINDDGVKDINISYVSYSFSLAQISIVRLGDVSTEIVEDEVAENFIEEKEDSSQVLLLIAVAFLIILLVLLFIFRKRRIRRRF